MFSDFWYLNFPCQKLFLTEGGSEIIFVTLFSSFYHEMLDIFQWKLYFGGVGKYPSLNKQCIQTNLDTEHNIKREFGAISWLVGLYVRWTSNSTWFNFASYVGDAIDKRKSLRRHMVKINHKTILTAQGIWGRDLGQIFLMNLSPYIHSNEARCVRVS